MAHRMMIVAGMPARFGRWPPPGGRDPVRARTRTQGTGTAWRPRSRFATRGARLFPGYLASAASRFTVAATITAPNRYDSSECRSTVRRSSAPERSVSETWNVAPTVNAR